MIRPSPNPSCEWEGDIFGKSANLLAGIAARVLGWRPGEFWEATPAELASALQADDRVAIEGDELSALLAQFPDDEGR